MGIIESIMNIKRQEAEQERQDFENVGNIINQFVNRDEIQAQKDLAKRDILSQIEAREAQTADLQKEDPLTDLLNRGRAVEAARSVGDFDLVRELQGIKPEKNTVRDFVDESIKESTPDIPIDTAQFVGEIDPVTGKETARSLRAKSDLKVEEQKKLSKVKPKSGEGAVKFASAKQNVKMIKSVKDLLGLKRNADGSVSMSDEAKRIILGSKFASVDFPVDPLGAISGTVSKAAGTKARKLDLWMDTLAENVLRMRTGAAAPEAEKIKEERRTLMRLMDTPDLLLERLEINEGLSNDIIQGFEPTREEETKASEDINAKVNAFLDEMEGK